ncbi:MAG: 50S ribosomal protein L11 methyltransferase [Gemmatimonadota bacterium]|nr:50S ribosomal protein L11 methyltransferase [Gemmatimonadota bacterium]
MDRKAERGWFEVRVDLPCRASETVSELLFALGSCGLQAHGGSASGRTGLTAYFPVERDSGRVVSGLWSGLQAQIGDLSALRVEVDEVPQEDWASSWKSRFRPVYPIPSIVVCPPWERVDDPEGGFSLVIEPKTAFGTGHHETTRLALKMMFAAVSPGDVVLDVGTGSGILSLAAARLDAARVTGIDIDVLAVENARANLRLNGSPGNVAFLAGTLACVTGTFDVVVANIDCPTLEDMLPALAPRVAARGNLILGGVQAQEQATLLQAVRAAELRAAEVVEENGWVGVRADWKDEDDGGESNVAAARKRPPGSGVRRERKVY